MQKVRVAIFALGGMALAGAALATGAAVSHSFHGVRILDCQTTEASNSEGAKAVATVQIGPYATDAVLLLDGDASARFAVAPADPDKLVSMRTELREDDALLESDAPRATISAITGRKTLRVMVGARTLFLKQGAAKTLSVASERLGEIDSDKVTMDARLHVTVIAAPQ